MTSYPTPKKALDKAISLLLLVLLAPVFAVVVAAMGFDMLVRPADRGAFLYRERRISRGRGFDLLKFRTLRCDVLDAMGDGEAHARLYEAEEENLTWAGRRILKPWYLDELPQLFNVLRGEMSLVGPRPWPPSMVATQVAARDHVPGRVRCRVDGTSAGSEGRRATGRVRATRHRLRERVTLRAVDERDPYRSGDPPAYRRRHVQRRWTTVLAAVRLAGSSRMYGILAKGLNRTIRRLLCELSEDGASTSRRGSLYLGEELG